MNDIENLNRSVGFSIERSHIRINKGSIYLNTIDNVEYQLIEVIDINQCLFKNLQTNENKLMSIHEFRNVIKHDGANVSIDSNLICKKPLPLLCKESIRHFYCNFLLFRNVHQY